MSVRRLRLFGRHMRFQFRNNAAVGMKPALRENAIGREDRTERHIHAGPTWEAENGSKVVGKKIAAVASPDPNSIPWLLLQGVAHDWHGMFSEVTYIQRLDTVGGNAPSDAPTAAGLIVPVPYTATYVFFVEAE